MFFYIRYASSDFQLNTDFVPFIRFVKVFWPQAKCHKETEYHSNTERIVREFEDEKEDYLVVTDTLGVNWSTARGIVACYIREGRERPREGRNNVRVDEEMRDC